MSFEALTAARCLVPIELAGFAQQSHAGNGKAG